MCHFKSYYGQHKFEEAQLKQQFVVYASDAEYGVLKPLQIWRSCSTEMKSCGNIIHVGKNTGLKEI